jgi:hypothetical protein
MMALFDGLVRFMTRDTTPRWAHPLIEAVRRIERKVNTIMALDLDVLHRILVGAQFLADREKANQQKIADLTTQLTAAQDQLGQATAAEAAEDEAEQAANTAATTVADTIDSLVKGPDTPTVEQPADPGQVADVVTGDAPVVVTDPGPTADTPPDAAPSVE